MKVFKWVLILVLLFSTVGCDVMETKPNGEDFYTYITIIDGHKYIKYRAGGGCCIIHAESCLCKAPFFNWK